MRRSGERLRITAQLIRANDGFHLWSETFERKDTDIFTIQDEIVSKLSQVLQFRLGIGAGAGRATSHNVNPRAYEEYLRGLDLWWNRESRTNREKAISTFRRVTELDPDFADAWSAYGASLALSNVAHTPNLTPETFNEQAENSLARALELDPNNVRAHAALISWNSKDGINISMAKQYIKKGLELGQNDAFMIYVIANYYYMIGNIPKSTEFYNRSMALDPLNQTVIRVRLPSFVSSGRYVNEAQTLSETYPCDEGECNSVPAAWALLQAALVSSSEDEIRIRRDKFKDFLLTSHRANPWLDLMSTHVDSLLGETVDPDYWKNVDLSSGSIQEGAWVIASILAQHGEEIRALDLLFSGQESSGQVFPNMEALYALVPGRLEMPESLRRHPRYHEFWNLPGMPSLAEARRANGQTAGLPLPIDGSDAQ